MSDKAETIIEYAREGMLAFRSDVHHTEVNALLVSQADEITDLQSQLAERDAELERLRERYNDLLYQVEQKHPDETRHETAKRLIRKAQQSSGETKAGLAQEGEG